MIKRSIEQELRLRNFEARNWNIESNVLVKDQKEQRRVHVRQGDYWQWQASPHCSKGDKCFQHDGNKRAKRRHRQLLRNHKVLQIQRDPKVLDVEVCLGFPVCRAGIISKVRVRIFFVRSGILQSARSTSQRRDANSVNGALMHTARLKFKLATKVQWLY